ncbi:MAG: hypothetical protein DRH26_01035 [Deltaproteobacteria bacterium]|nr:MAG: hypothetical protein DRH26_01035 [Deltaproteobacteria bacterium]
MISHCQDVFTDINFWCKQPKIDDADIFQHQFFIIIDVHQQSSFKHIKRVAIFVRDCCYIDIITSHIQLSLSQRLNGSASFCLTIKA